MRIILATDGSECSENAAHFLSRFELTPKDEIIVLHVVSSVPFDDDYHGQILQAIKRISPKIIEGAVRVLKHTKAQIIPHEMQDDPAAGISRAAADHGADLVVMGARGVRGLQSIFLGSVTRSVTALTSVPLLITKPILPEHKGGMKILFATDGTPCSQAAARALAALPFPNESEVTVMQVAWSGYTDIPERFILEIDERAKEAIARARTKEYGHAEKIVEEHRVMLAERFGKVNALIKGGDPADEILRHAASLQADMIAVGSRGLKGLKQMMGSVSRKILEHSACPVLIGKAT